MKNLLILLVMGLLLFACQNEAPKEETEAKSEEVAEEIPEVITITFADFKNNPETYVDKLVRVEVTCTYPNCNILFSGETCDGGSVEYCGPEGHRTVSCTDLGFVSCGSGPGGVLVRGN